jgi:hypothetical protein
VPVAGDEMSADEGQPPPNTSEKKHFQPSRTECGPALKNFKFVVLYYVT